MSLFAPCASVNTLFAPCASAATLTTTLAFTSATRSQNSTGEVLLSFEPTFTLATELFPRTGTFQRFVQGQWTEINFTAIHLAYASITYGNRVTIPPPFASPVSGVLCEVVDVRHYGAETTELDLRFVRR